MNNKNLKNKKAFSLIELSIVLLIIGVIIAGITQSSRLIGAFKLSSARATTQSSPVVSIKDLAVWLESTAERAFSDANTNYSLNDGDQVQTWYDSNPQSTTKINFAQATSGYQPLYKTGSGTINSLPTLKFDGADDYMTNTTALLSDYAQSDQITIFFVHKIMDTDNSTFMFITADGGTTRINFHAPENTSFLRFDFGTCCTAGAGRVSVAVPANYISNARVTTLIKKPTSYSVVRVNGSDILNTASTSTFSSTLLTTTATANIGATGVADYLSNSYMGEIIIFRRALKADEVTDVERYLGKKWGITVS